MSYSLDKRAALLPSPIPEACTPSVLPFLTFNAERARADSAIGHVKETNAHGALFLAIGNLLLRY